MNPQLKEFFRQKFDKTGIALTVAQLLAYAKEKKLKGPEINKKEIGKFIYNETHLAKFSNVKRPKAFQTIGVLRPGVFFIDYAVFEAHLAGYNNKNTGFLLAVENVTNRLFVHPCGDKTTQSWFKAIQAFVEMTGTVTKIFSDRDSVATAPKFQQEISRKYNISWHFLKKGSKSYLAERYIGFVKSKLSQAMLHKDTKNWIQFVKPLTDEYNAEKIAGTEFRRRQVGRENFSPFLQQLMKTKEPELLFTGSSAGEFLNKDWNRKIFRFQLGQKVLLARRANWKKFADNPEKKSYTFLKASTKGGYGDKQFTISGRQLRVTKGFKKMVAVYSLTEMGPAMHFYENDLKSINSV